MASSRHGAKDISFLGRSGAFSVQLDEQVVVKNKYILYTVLVAAPGGSWINFLDKSAQYVLD